MSILPLIFFFIVIIPSAIIHEYMHGWVADRLGDPTARLAGRLTLNPIVHIDPWGTLIMPLALFFLSGGNFMFSYAKPVPYNPYNLRGGKWSPAWVAIAGPLSNFSLAVMFGLTIQLAPISASLAAVLSIIVYANVLLGVFNLVPIPPLDGSKILYALLPDSAWKLKAMLERYGFVILLMFVFFFFHLISPIIQTIYLFLTGGVGVF